MALRKQGKYVEAIDLYRTLWDKHRAECNEWDGWGYAYCLRKMGRAEEALSISSEIYTAHPDFPQIVNLYGWCLYDTEIGKRDNMAIEQNEGKFLQAASTIVSITKQETYSPYVRTAFRVIDYLKSRAAYPANRILEWADKLDPAQLSKEAGRGVDQTGKPVAYASDREKWYADRCKAFFELGRFQECLDLSQQALAEFTTFHHDNDIWFRWRIALSKAELGDKETAIAELQAILARKKDWFIQHKVAQLLHELGRTEDALKYAVDAALNPGDLEYKWELFTLMGTILEAQSKPDDARKHVLLAAKLRQEHGWKIPQPLQALIQAFSIDMATSTSAAALHEELKGYWKSLKLAEMPQLAGEIKNLIADGKSGFIRGDNGQDYYFKKRSFQGSWKRLGPGLRVKFYVEKNPDPGKRDIAVFIEEIES